MSSRAVVFLATILLLWKKREMDLGLGCDPESLGV